ncbi:hypothetical protein KQX54_010689 [Cotesia glomerata]|uniref:Uncharacterized protein n=1 Tax=Cotesia glomerata TaxID=32391 RepID=A0AAV7IQL6_COTGL|nr:hypothetical protein KQX54_010689 [Cotesia glomerata]
MHHTAPWYLPWSLKLVPLPLPAAHPTTGIPSPAGLHLLAPLPSIYAPEPRKEISMVIPLKFLIDQKLLFGIYVFCSFPQNTNLKNRKFLINIEKSV